MVGICREKSRYPRKDPTGIAGTLDPLIEESAELQHSLKPEPRGKVRVWGCGTDQDFEFMIWRSESAGERERERARSALDLEQASKRERGACPKPLHHSPGERKKRGLWFNFQGSGYMFRAKGCNYRLGLRLINSTFNPKPYNPGFRVWV